MNQPSESSSQRQTSQQSTSRPNASQRTIFLEALDQETAQQREAYLRSACGDDVELRSSVESLLAAHDQPSNPLDAGLLEGFSGAPSADSGVSENEKQFGFEQAIRESHLGMTINGYRLMEQIGEGGFGLVFVAQQEKPVKRKVALKIIKPGTGSREVLARFHAERQAVAMMDHPNIARVFDAGVTEDARPYFVMELVRGVPITRFCDAHSLTLRQRLKLFQDVCAATHHAHQKGVVHRDLKPSNVMVTLHDDKSVAKVIDFGVAKAIGENLTDKTLYTRFHSMIGTPLYMSPEQASMSGLDVDTRSDIYSLGVLLYELLTGTTPFDRERMDSAGYDEMRRIIRDEEPPKPSTRLTTIRSGHGSAVTNASVSSAIGNHAAAIDSVSRRTETRSDRASIPSDLDWIVMKAMEKDRNRRYESAAAFRADIQRFLAGEPIEARPPSQRYRLQKFADRNRIALLTGTLVALALVVGTAASLYQASLAIHERNEKEIALRDAIEARREVEGFAERLKEANLLLGNARSLEFSADFVAADSSYSDAVDLVPNYYLVWLQRAALRGRQNLWREAANDYAQALLLEAPLVGREWEGAAAIFFLTDQQDSYRDLYSKLFKDQQENAPPMSFEAIRSCLIDPASIEDAERLLVELDEMMRFAERPPGGPPRGRAGSAREAPNGVELGRNPFSGRRPGGPVNDQPPRDGDRRRPAFNNHVPRSVMDYAAAWAALRAGDTKRAIEFLDMAAQSRGPSREMVHSLRAIAFYHDGDDQRAGEFLDLADHAIDRAIDQATASRNDSRASSRPRIDLLEMIILHREATLLITGKQPPLDARITQSANKTRGLLDLKR